MNRSKHKTTRVLLTMSLFFAQVENSVAERDHETAKRLQEAGVIMPLETILKKQWREDLERILEVELENEDGRRVYEIEYLDRAGAAWEMLIDAQTGRLLRKERDD
jgi:uncharacterized membrane protein YkoI